MRPASDQILDWLDKIQRDYQVACVSCQIGCNIDLVPDNLLYVLKNIYPWT